MENNTPDYDKLKTENLFLKQQLEEKKSCDITVLNLLEKTSKIAKIGGWDIDLTTMKLTWTKEVYRIHEVDDDFIPDVQTAINFYAPSAQPIITQAVNSSIETGVSWDLELPLITAKGNTIWVRAKGETLMINGKAIRVYGTFQNINDKFELQNQLHDNNKILEEAQHLAQLGYYVLDITTGIWSSSPILKSIFGIDEHYVTDIVGWVNIVAPTDSQMMLDYFSNEVVGQKKKFNKEYRIINQSDKKEKWVHGIGRLEFDKEGNPIKMIGVIQDITNRKLAELKLHENEMNLKQQNEEYMQLNEEYVSINDEYLALNEELHLSNESLLIAKEKADESNKLKSAFLSNMSHEIRTPMNGIVGFSNLLINKTLTPENHKKYTTIIKNCSNQLLTLIDDLIDISKIEANQINIEQEAVNLNQVFNELIELFQSKAHKKNLLIITTIPSVSITNITDHNRLTQVMHNLISNAIKFTNKGHIEIGYTVQENQIEFFVKDTGIGIPEEYKEIIFDRFRQAHADKNQTYGGTGLGLAISKSLIELLGGTIWFDSVEYVGTSFYFTIPLNITDELILIKKDLSTSSLLPQIKNNLNILIAEDDYINYLYLAELLDHPLIKIWHASNGQTAVEIAQKTPDINMVLMDLKMPIMDGFTATQKIKTFNTNIPIIALTAFTQSTEKQYAMQCGCCHYLTKPVNTRLLFEAIEKYSN